jgi:hypothetical protein
VRFWSGESKGSPAREVHAGASYWSQDSAILVFALPSPHPNRITVRWPSGGLRSYPFDARLREQVLSITAGEAL